MQGPIPFYFRGVLIVLLILAMVGASAQSSAIDSLDRELDRLAAQGYFSGNVLLAEGGNVLLRKSYGYADFANKVPLQEDAVLELASVSKQFTAAGVSLLVTDGILDLNAPISDYLPELAAYPTLTTYQLLHHSGGLPDYMSVGDSLAAGQKFVTNQYVLDYLRDQRPGADFAPGDRYEYSNTGYLVLASLIERLSGSTYGEFLKQRLFEPLGMTDSQVYQRRYDAERSVDRFVPGYVWDGDAYVIPDSVEGYESVKTLDGVVGDGMVNSTLDDLYRWDRALAEGKLLDTALLFRPGMTTGGDTIEYGFGQRIQRHPTYGYTISHSGGWPGVATFIYRFPHTDRTLIMLRNDDGGRDPRITILRTALRVVNGLSLKVEGLYPPQVEPVEPAVAEELVGTYVVSPDFKLVFFIDDDGKFMVQATDQDAFLVSNLPEEDRYSLPEVNAEFAFQRDGGGQVTSVTLYQGGAEVEAVRE